MDHAEAPTGGAGERIGQKLHSVAEGLEKWFAAFLLTQFATGAADQASIFFLIGEEPGQDARRTQGGSIAAIHAAEERCGDEFQNLVAEVIFDQLAYGNVFFSLAWLEENFLEKTRFGAST